MNLNGWFLLVLFNMVALGLEFPHLDVIRPRVSRETQAGAVEELIQRVLGNQSYHFHIEVDESNGPKDRDTFNILSDGATVYISGTSGVAAAMGFYYFLKNECGCQYTWAGNQLNLPYPLPVVSRPGITVTSNDRFRYYQNVCTSSYSFVWWNWTRWERQIDWMAMNGINLPLAFTGQEAIFQRVYLKLGLNLQDLEAHFGGPAFLAWARMGNMRGWGGPLPQSWIQNQLALQHKILDRMRSLGMVPVLPGFAGHVPAAITRLYPNASVSRLGRWGRFDDQYCCTYLLDFQDSLFQKIGSAFIREMKTEFGVDHVYNADSFNEMTPKSSNWSYLQSAGKAVYGAMTDADPNAIWLMQGWLFLTPWWQPKQIEALLTSVPKGKMIVLDLAAETAPVYSRTNSFYGQPFIWCMLHNFGGTMELFGVIESINKGPFIARQFPNNSMVGTGLTPEGIFTNEVIYEFMNENAYVKKPRNLTEWFAKFAVNRYGQVNQHAINAWQLLKVSVYNNTDELRDHSKQVIPTSRPKLRHPLEPDVWYEPADLFNSWKEMNQAGQTIDPANQLFRYDLVDVARNSLQLIAEEFYHKVIIGYNSANMTFLESAGKELMTLLDDLDRLLGSDSHFLLGTWLRDARSCGVTNEEKDLMEYNARNQITLWGPNGNIRDYGSKQWSGLMKDFYAPRWDLFLTMLKDSLAQKTPFNESSYDDILFRHVEQPFTFNKDAYPIVVTGVSTEISRNLFEKYRQVMQSQFFNQYKYKTKSQQKFHSNSHLMYNDRY